MFECLDINDSENCHKLCVCVCIQKEKAFDGENLDRMCENFSFSLEKIWQKNMWKKFN